MQYTKLDLPLPEKPESLDVIDASKLQRFMDCPRGFFIEHVLGLQKEQRNIHFVAGSAIHEAMEIFMKASGKIGYTDQVVSLAYDAFLKVYREAYPNPLDDDANVPKDPANIAALLNTYAQMWRHDRFKTLFTEVSFAVPIAPDRIMHGKMDSVYEENGLIWSMEHKTTGYKSEAWMNKWSSMPQVGLYTHALHSFFENVAGVKINGMILRRPTKQGPSNEVLRIPITPTKQLMRYWLWELNHWYDQLDWNMRMLEKAREDHDILVAFPRNPMSCCKAWGGCSHPGICNANVNPLHLANQEPPPGYKREYWDPRRLEEQSNYKADPETKEIKKIEHKEADE